MRTSVGSGNTRTEAGTIAELCRGGSSDIN